jgi:hypothetical protein
VRLARGRVASNHQLVSLAHHRAGHTTQGQMAPPSKS